MYENMLMVYLVVVVALAAVAVLASMITIIWSAIRGKMKGDYTKLKYNGISLLCIAIMCITWFANFGMYRLLLTVVALPITHSILFFYNNNFAAGYVSRSRYLKVLMIISYISYILMYTLFPDGESAGYSFALFGIVRNKFYMPYFLNAAKGLFGLNVLVMFLQLIESIRVKCGIKIRLPRRKKKSKGDSSSSKDEQVSATAKKNDKGDKERKSSSKKSSFAKKSDSKKSSTKKEPKTPKRTKTTSK